MKTQNSNNFFSLRNNYLLVVLCSLLTTSQFLNAQTTATAEAKKTSTEDSKNLRAEKTARPLENDKNSNRVLDNYFKATGGRYAHTQINSIRATGIYQDAEHSKEFELFETKDGQRRLTFKWKFKGRYYRETFGYNNQIIWKQTLAPQKQLPETFEGAEANHFAHQNWLLHTFMLPSQKSHTFQYQGKSRINGRNNYMLIAYGPNDIRSWYYFDSKRFLLTRNGGKKPLANTIVNVDYQASHFKAIDGVLLPTKIYLVTGNQSFGHIEFQTIESNPAISGALFNKPQDNQYILRQQTKPAK